MFNFFSDNVYQKECIPVPEIFKDTPENLLSNIHPEDNKPTIDIFYATDRKVLGQGYGSDRDDFLHLGKAAVRLGHEHKPWEWFLKQSLEAKRQEKLTMMVTGTQKFGYLWNSCPYFNSLQEEQEAKEQSQLFAQEINKKLERSKTKDIYIYVSGFKVCFEDPILLTRSIWHFMGYDGAFIAYAWPSTPGLLSYAHDLETTQYCARNFRLLIDFLAKSIDVNEIHIIGHSAGTRIVCNALKELRLVYSSDDEASLRKKLKIGHVILIGADFDRMFVKSYYRDNILDLLRNVTVYLSTKDMALKFSKYIFKGDRLGTLDKRNLSELELKVLGQQKKVHIVDVTSAKKATSGSGHLYHMTSPLISSDIIRCLKDNFPPQERNLTKVDQSLVWQFAKI